ncbi:hypothetical protein LAZ67_3001401 [Cordylochernes scorpioides]|uniref:Tc1-like transposase DDE domain-containing protein n=1 Tax=Cordylochernes scorpioides TaxID=51811 RepID=A0ABY6K6Y2_9ARAC|nr:hypothetical protein LAZ67_3001401 [Cordylochernes scorpioides]
MPPVYLLFGITPSYINKLTKAYPPIEEARRIANENTEKLHLKLVKRYNESHKTPNLKIGDKVLYKIPYQSGQEIDKPCQPENKHATIVNISKVKLWDPVTEDNTEPPFPFQEEEDLEGCLGVEPNKQASTDSPQVLFSSIKKNPTEPLEKLLLVSVDTQTESEPVVSCEVFQRSPLLRIQGTMTAQRYVDDVLRPVTLPYLQGVPNALYQQDNARPHTARISQQALQDVQMLPWPPYSPDLSPIEHVWDIIGRRLHALPQPRSEDELWQMVEREWRAIPQDAIRTLIDTLPRRVTACIVVRGGPTCY